MQTKTETTSTQANPKSFSIFHFNDVYDLEPGDQEPKGGAAYFKALLDEQKQKYSKYITLFSGDALSPSLLSTEFQGENMIKPLNSFGIDLACFGNHDLDFKMDRVKYLIGKTNFPWLLSNVYDKRTETRLADGLEYKIMEINGLKVGFFSLAEKQWIDTLYPFYKEFCRYVDFLQFAEYMVRELKETHKCDMIIALTHMMKYNDIKLAQNVNGIDLILGGHDHLICHEKIGGSVLVKSGTNFRNFSIIEVFLKDQNYVKPKVASGDHNKFLIENDKCAFSVTLKEVNHQEEKIIPDVVLDEYITQIYSTFKIRQEKVACFTKTPMDLRFVTIRTQQTAFLEFICTFYRHYLKSECVLMNSGNFRMDCQVAAGPITVGIITKIVEDTIVTKSIPGDKLLKGLETAVSMYPNMSGRYSAFAGVQFEWDCNKESYSRVNKESVRINGSKLDMNRVYVVSMHSFVGAGGDGYECFKECEMTEGTSPVQNKHVLHELLSLNSELIDSYQKEYPGNFTIVEHEGQRYLELDLKETGNIRMVSKDE